MSIDVQRFSTEPDLDLNPENLALANAALAALDSALPLLIQPIVDGVSRDGRGARFESRDPNHWDRVVTEAVPASAAVIDDAVATLQAAQPQWAAWPVHERSELLRNAAKLLRTRRFEALAVLRRECGKTWREADAEYCEAVDFLELYANAAEDQEGSPALLDGPFEKNRMVHTARGVAAAIIPWNFPIAIGLGMTVGPLVMGNAVAVKPAEQTPSTGAFIARLLLDAGVPSGVLAMLPGDGEVGKILVADPRVDTLLFTGSRDVGLEIIARAGVTGPDQKQVKKVVAEMGGKNCIVVDQSADLIAAAEAVVASGFAFAGQKCSAGSRVLVHAQVAPAFKQVLKPLVDAVTVGPADDDENYVTGVIDRDSLSRLRTIRDRMLSEGTLVAESAQIPAASGNFVRPVVVEGLPADSPLLSEEVFGPLVTLEEFDNLEEAFSRIDALPYALTGGIFATSRDAIDLAVRMSPVGNLYINRKVTGAYVGRQPFGGSRMSGIGVKAGSPEYVRQFINQTVVSEFVGANR